MKMHVQCETLAASNSGTYLSGVDLCALYFDTKSLILKEIWHACIWPEYACFQCILAHEAVFFQSLHESAISHGDQMCV